MENPRKVKKEYIIVIGMSILLFNKECNIASDRGYSPVFNMKTLSDGLETITFQQWSKTTLIENNKA